MLLPHQIMYCLISKTFEIKDLSACPWPKKYGTNHPKESPRLSSIYNVSNQLKSLVCIDYLYNGHCTKQEKYYFTDFCRSMCQLRNSYIRWRSLRKKVKRLIQLFNWKGMNFRSKWNLKIEAKLFHGKQAKIMMLTPMLRITHKLTAINNPTPLLLKARDSSKIMPTYPIPKSNAIARSCLSKNMK